MAAVAAMAATAAAVAVAVATAAAAVAVAVVATAAVPAALRRRRRCTGGCYGCAGCGGVVYGAWPTRHPFPVASYVASQPAQTSVPATIVVTLPADARLNFRRLPHADDLGSPGVHLPAAPTRAELPVHVDRRKLGREGRPQPSPSASTCVQASTSQVSLSFPTAVATASR